MTLLQRIALAVILLCAPMQGGFGSELDAGSNDNIDFTLATTPTMDDFTIMMWLVIDDDSPAVSPAHLLNVEGASDDFAFAIRTNSAGEIECQRSLSSGTRPEVDADLANFTHYAEGKLIFFACSMDSFGTTKFLCVGDVNNLCAEPSGYNTSTNGSGTLETLGTSFQLATRGVSCCYYDITMCGLDFRDGQALTLQQVQARQFAHWKGKASAATLGVWTFWNATDMQEFSGNGSSLTPSGAAASSVCIYPLA